jgi:hypothetical protein
LGRNERITEDLREAGLPARADADAVIEYPFAAMSLLLALFGDAVAA